LFDQPLPDRIQSFARLFFPLKGNQAVIKIFPKLAVLLQINQRSYLLAFVIGHELGPSHFAFAANNIFISTALSRCWATLPKVKACQPSFPLAQFSSYL